MNELEQSLRGGGLHHAYLIEGDESTAGYVARLLEDVRGVETIGNPDIHIRTYTSFGIDDGREIQSLESKRATQGREKIFILTLERMTREAQNALLKTFEEPTEGTRFFVVVPSADRFLPTLLSRVVIVRADQKETTNTFAKKFLAAGAPERLALVADIIEEKDRHQAIARVNELEEALHSRTDFGAPSTVPTEAFEALQSTRSYLADQSSSVKVLLEHLSVMLPKLS